MACPTSSVSSAALQMTMIPFFRQNLEDVHEAAWWWQMAVLAAPKKD